MKTSGGQNITHNLHVVQILKCFCGPDVTEVFPWSRCCWSVYVVQILFKVFGWSRCWHFHGVLMLWKLFWWSRCGWSFPGGPDAVEAFMWSRCCWNFSWVQMLLKLFHGPIVEDFLVVQKLLGVSCHPDVVETFPGSRCCWKRSWVQMLLKPFWWSRCCWSVYDAVEAFLGSRCYWNVSGVQMLLKLLRGVVHFFWW